jgi:hypothetical protein
MLPVVLPRKYSAQLGRPANSTTINGILATFSGISLMKLGRTTPCTLTAHGIQKVGVTTPPARHNTVSKQPQLDTWLCSSARIALDWLSIKTNDLYYCDRVLYKF